MSRRLRRRSVSMRATAYLKVAAVCHSRGWSMAGITERVMLAWAAHQEKTDGRDPVSLEREIRLTKSRSEAKAYRSKVKDPLQLGALVVPGLTRTLP